MSQKIVCLDGFTANPGDLSWERFEGLGEFVAHDRTAESAVVERVGDASIVLTNKSPLSTTTIKALPNLKYIGVLATGYNVVDIEAAWDAGIIITNIPAYGTDSVAQHTIALLLELARRVGIHDAAVHDNAWTTSKDFCFTVAPIVELTGKTLGIVGLGNIGKAVARIGAAMGMRIIAAHTRVLEKDELDGLEVEFTDMDRVFCESDAVSLHCPLTPDTENLVNAKRLAAMKQTAFIINTGRGQLVDEQALTEMLKSGQIAGAAVDVLHEEPPRNRPALLDAPNCIVTPHVAWYAREARARLIAIAADNLQAYLNGKPVNTVTPR